LQKTRLTTRVLKDSIHTNTHTHKHTHTHTHTHTRMSSDTNNYFVEI